MIQKTIRHLLFIWLVINTAYAGDDINIRDRLQSSYPWLHVLYQRYPQFHDRLATYAIQQGFHEPPNVLVTIVHELIHIDSAAHNAYSVGGRYLAPYVNKSAWPYLNNADVSAYLTPQDVTRLGLIYSSYIRATPSNRLGNVLDEINAYSQSLPFLCAEAPPQAVIHVQNLTGHLTLVDFYLRTLANNFPEQYRKLASNRVSRGALETLVANAYTTLNVCFRGGLREADPTKVQKDATVTFSEQPF